PASLKLEPRSVPAPSDLPASRQSPQPSVRSLLSASRCPPQGSYAPAPQGLEPSLATLPPSGGLPHAQALPLSSWPVPLVSQCHAVAPELSHAEGSSIQSALALVSCCTLSRFSY